MSINVTDSGTLFVLFGMILLFIGLLGGGLEIKEIKIPRVGVFVRSLAMVFGLGFLLVGTGFRIGGLDISNIISQQPTPTAQVNIPIASPTPVLSQQNVLPDPVIAEPTDIPEEEVPTPSLEEEVPPTEFVPPFEPPPAEPVFFTIYDELSEGQIEEEIDVVVDGVFQDTIYLDETDTSYSLTVEVDEPGRYGYTLEGSTLVDLGDTEETIYCVGQGTIEVEPDKVFFIAASLSGTTCLLTLVEAP